MGKKVEKRPSCSFWKLTVAVCLLFSVPAGASAQSVTLAQAADLMRTNEVQFEILDLEQDVSDEIVRQAFGERLPRVRLSVSYIQTYQDIVNQDNTTFQEGTSSYPTTTVTLAATQPLYDQVRFRALPLARAEQELVSMQAEAARTELSGLLVSSFLGVARAQLRVDQARAIMSARQNLVRDLAQLVSAGRADAERQLRAEGDVFAAEADVSDAELDLSEALFELHRFTGPDIGGVSYRGGVGVAELRSFLQTFNEARLGDLNPQIQIARAEAAVAARRLHRVRAAFQPTVDLTLELENEQTDGSLFGGGSEIQSAEAGLQMNWSIYEGGVRRSQVREAERRLEIAQLRIKQTQDLAVRRYRSLVSALEKSLDVVAATERDRRVAVQRVAAAEQQVGAGRRALEQVLEAKLRRDTMGIQAEGARIRAVQLQAELYALFGALDIETLSRDFAGG
ncbi:TolC family protein [Roseovarius aquimarinus]|uniref:TolC family protein n=1 Tax=Roseovarius aquimarinus TaxID=1229156 RepID=A0ABW7I6G0_9RHOB